MILKRPLITGVTLVMACTYFASAVPNPTTCGPVGSTSTGGTHNYDLDTDGILTVSYDQCLQHLIDDITTNGAVAAYDEYGAGISGAAYAAVTSSAPYGDSRLGGVANCWAPNFTGHHGADNTINTADTVLGGNIRVFISADWFDNTGEAVFAGTGQDVRDPCGDNSVDDDQVNNAWDDFFATSEPCGFYAGGASVIQLNCAVNGYAIGGANPNGPAPRGATLADNAGLDGGITTFIGISTGNVSIATSGTAWTASSGGGGCQGQGALEASARYQGGDEYDGGTRVDAQIFWYNNCGSGSAQIYEQGGYCTWSSGNWRLVSCVWDSRAPPGDTPSGAVVIGVTGTFACTNPNVCGSSSHSITAWAIGYNAYYNGRISRCEYDSNPAGVWRYYWCGSP